MASTVSQAFVEFARRIDATDAQRDLIATRRRTVDGYLRDSFGPSSNMPLISTHIIGSADRETIIRPLDDIDVMAVFNDDLVWNTYRFDSTKLLYRVRDALSGYRVEVVGARGQAVRLFYKSGPHVDIAPVFPLTDGSGAYVLPAGGGRWVGTHRQYHADFMARRNRELSGYLKPLIRLLKRWNRVHSNRLKSFHLEMVAQATFGSLNGNTRQAVHAFFDWAPGYLHVQDPAGHGGDLGAYLFLREQAVRDSMRSARDRAARAMQAEAAGDHAEAIRLWRIIFGDEFPAYTAPVRSYLSSY